MLRLSQFAPLVNGLTWIEPLDLVLRSGEWVMIQGRNGSGRSTLAQALAGHHDHLGEWVINGQVLSRHHPQQRFLHGVTYVPEHRDVFAGLSPIEHLHLGLGPSGSWHDTNACQRVTDALTRLPSLHKRMHLQAKHLSGGEQQLLSVARALISSPKCVILDEPFEGLAKQARGELLSWLLDLQTQGLMLIWFEQSTPEEVLPHVSQVLHLDRGIWSK